MNERLYQTIGELIALNRALEERGVERTEEIRLSEERFRSLFEKVHVAALVIDPEDGSIQDANATAAAFYGWSREELLSKKISEINTLPPEDIRREMDAACQEKRSYFLFRHRRADGSVRDVEVYCGPITVRGKSLLYSIIHDVTDRKESEERVRRLLSEQEIILNTAPIGIIFLKERRILWSNPHFNAVFGYEPEEIRGRSTEILYTSLEDFEQTGREVYARIASGGIAAKEFMMVRKDGTPFWISLVGRAVDPADAGDGSIWMIQDITERKDAEESLRELNRTLEARVEAETRMRMERERMLVQQSKMAAMGEMIGAIAHQWRQPLNSVGVIVQDIRGAFEAGRLDRPYLLHAVEDTMEQLGFMSRTIDDFRFFFRPDKEKSSFDIRRAMGQVLSMVSAQLRAHQIRWLVTCQAHGGEPVSPGDRDGACCEMMVNGYENEIKQVFLNLIDNAKDAILERRGEPGGEPREGFLRIVFDRVDERVVVRIIDNGGGIPEKILDRIFDPYFSTKDQGRGTGIGLYMSKMIVENHMGGSIAARNTDDGAEFRIEV